MPKNRLKKFKIMHNSIFVYIQRNTFILVDFELNLRLLTANELNFQLFN